MTYERLRVKTYPVIERGLRLEPELALLAVEVVVDPAAVKVVPAEHPLLEPQPVPLVERELPVPTHQLVDSVVNPQPDRLGHGVVLVLTVPLLLN